MPELAKLRSRIAELEAWRRASEDAEERYRALFEKMLNGYAYCQMLFEGDRPVDFVYLAVNPAFSALTGLQDVVGRKVTEVIPDIRKTNPELFEIYGRVARGGKPERFEYRLGPLGVWFDISVYGAREECFVAVFDNITAHKKGEEALRESADRATKAFRSIPDPLVISRLADGTIVEVNDEWPKVFGYSREEAVGKSSLALNLFADSADRQRALALLREHGSVRDFELQIRQKSGGLRTVVMSAERLEIQGEQHLLTVIHDITERRQAEELLRLQGAALYATADAVVITDRTGLIEWSNPAFTRLSGYAADEAVGKHHRDLVHSGTHPSAFFEDLWETILAGRTWRGEIVNRRKDGRLYTEDQHITPIVDGSGTITHFVAIQQDITERLQLEAQLRQSQKMESVGQLASGIAHDFNNLLTVINGMSELVLTQIDQADPMHADVHEILRAGERAATLTGQLLAFSRQQMLEPRVLNLSSVIAGLESLLRRLLGEDIDLVVVPASEAGHVKADPGQIEQVITNLAVNARDAMPQGGKLTIEVQNVTVDEATDYLDGETVPAGSYVRLSVGDSGTGMDKATRARIFEPFFTTKGPGKGTGLGLSTAFGIVKQSQGFIRVQSEVGQGTTFNIYLPQVAAASAEIKMAAPAVAPRACTETILVAEDNAGLRKLVTRFLASAGYTVLEADTGDEALRLLARRDQAVHLLLSDVVMPGMSGRLLAEQVARTRPGMKVIYMSGYTSDTVVRHGVLEANMPFLNKPFTAAALLRKVRDVLDST